jgi:hypothetical protein
MEQQLHSWFLGIGAKECVWDCMACLMSFLF